MSEPDPKAAGETAAQRQATTELAFFASVGDLHRCKKITTRWGLTISDPRTADYDKRTPLHLAAAEGCHSVVVWLIAQGANVNAVDRFKRTPLEDAVRGDHGEVAALLLQHGAKVVSKEGELIELADSPLAGNVRMFTGYDPDWEVDPATLKILEQIGEGEFGVVHKGRWFGTTVAVKILKDVSKLAMGDFRTELNTLQKLHHPHTVQFLGAVTKQQPFMIVTEYMTGGSLLDLFKSNKVLTPWRSVQVALDCARGMAYLHNRSPCAVVHRDLKPANVMLGGPKVYTNFHRTVLHEEMGTLKIADFGLSKSLKLARRKQSDRSSVDLSRSADVSRNGDGCGAGNGSGSGPKPANIAAKSVGLGDASFNSAHNPAYKLTGEQGSYRYMAPEVFRHEQYCNKVDVYSFAMIAYQLFEGVPPFATLDPVAAVRAAALEDKRPEWGAWRRQHKEPREDVPLPIRLLVEKCWAADPDARPEFEDIVEHLDAISLTLKKPVTEESHDKGCTVQ